jgi:transcriptional/translational regulatory protein YebC/TACO1
MKRETKYTETERNKMYTKTGRECNLAKRIYRNETKQNMSKHTCLFQARSG